MPFLILPRRDRMGFKEQDVGRHQPFFVSKTGKVTPTIQFKPEITRMSKTLRDILRRPDIFSNTKSCC